MNNKDFYDLMKRRQSCRSFDANKPVEKELLMEILETAKLSPSACNSQPYELFVVQGEKAKTVIDAKSMNFNSFIDDCSSFIIIAESSYTLPAKIGSIIKGVDFKAIDIGILCANLVNSAAALGLETCILGLFDEKKLKKLIDRKNRIRLVLAVGYPKEGYSIKEKVRKPFDENFHFL